MNTNEKAIVLAKIIKRLELIKNLILLEEYSEINLHFHKIRALATDTKLEDIIILIEKKDYSKALSDIDDFINCHLQIGLYIDPDIERLKVEAKVIEAELNELSDEKADLEKLIHDFGTRHNNELGELILKILRFRKDKAKGTPIEAETKIDYDDYCKEYEKSNNDKINQLTEEEYKELKHKYRKASKLCHPDVVNDEQKEIAEKLFAELNAAYERNHLEKVREILENLEKGKFFVSKSDSITEKQLLKDEIEKLRMRIRELKIEILEIKQSEAFATISSIEDWDRYFIVAREKLELQAKALENGE